MACVTSWRTRSMAGREQAEGRQDVPFDRGRNRRGRRLVDGNQRDLAARILRVVGAIGRLLYHPPQSLLDQVPIHRLSSSWLPRSSVSVWTRASRRQPSPITAPASIVQNGPTVTSRPSSASGLTTAEGWIVATSDSC